MPLNRHHPRLPQESAKAGTSKARPRICWMRCSCVQSKCWLCSTTCAFLLRTTRPSGTFAGQKCSKRFLAPFAVRRGPPLFAASAVIFRRCTSKDTPCSLLLLLSFMVNLYRSLGHLSSYNEEPHGTHVSPCVATATLFGFGQPDLRSRYRLDRDLFVLLVGCRRYLCPAAGFLWALRPLGRQACRASTAPPGPAVSSDPYGPGRSRQCDERNDDWFTRRLGAIRAGQTHAASRRRTHVQH